MTHFPTLGRVLAELSGSDPMEETQEMSAEEINRIKWAAAFGIFPWQWRSMARWLQIGQPQGLSARSVSPTGRSVRMKISAFQIPAPGEYVLTEHMTEAIARAEFRIVRDMMASGAWHTVHDEFEIDPGRTQIVL